MFCHGSYCVCLKKYERRLSAANVPIFRPKNHQNSYFYIFLVSISNILQWYFVTSSFIDHLPIHCIYIPIVGKGRVSCCITFIEYLYIQYIYIHIYICTTWNSTFTHKKLRRCRPHGVVFHVGLVSSQGGSAGVSQRRRPARKAVAGDVIYPAAGWLVGSWRGHP